MSTNYDQWKEKGMDDGLDGLVICDACRKELHHLCGELDEPCECACTMELSE